MLTFNYQHGTQTVSLAEIEAFLGSDLDGSSPPNKNAARRAVFLFGENSEAEKAARKSAGMKTDIKVMRKWQKLMMNL